MQNIFYLNNNILNIDITDRRSRVQYTSITPYLRNKHLNVFCITGLLITLFSCSMLSSVSCKMFDYFIARIIAFSVTLPVMVGGFLSGIDQLSSSNFRLKASMIMLQCPVTTKKEHALTYIKQRFKSRFAFVTNIIL